MNVSDWRVGRAGVVVVEDGAMAFVKRVRDGRTYFAVPGGGVQHGESFEDAAVREAREELGFEVELLELVWEEERNGQPHRYFRARRVGGDFGLRATAEDSFSAAEWRAVHGDAERGTSEPVWLSLDDLDDIDVVPRGIRDVL